MRGWYLLGGALVGNLACHLTGRPTICHDTRKLPPEVVVPAWAGLSVLLYRHLYPKES